MQATYIHRIIQHITESYRIRITKNRQNNFQEFEQKPEKQSTSPPPSMFHIHTYPYYSILVPRFIMMPQGNKPSTALQFSSTVLHRLPLDPNSVSSPSLASPGYGLGMNCVGICGNHTRQIYGNFGDVMGCSL